MMIEILKNRKSNLKTKLNVKDPSNVRSSVRMAKLTGKRGSNIFLSQRNFLGNTANL